MYLSLYYPNTPNQKEFSNEFLSTPWNDIEVGMALMKGVPILLVCDPSIEQGVFDSNLSECFVGRISSFTDIRLIESDTNFRNWLNKII